MLNNHPRLNSSFCHTLYLIIALFGLNLSAIADDDENGPQVDRSVTKTNESTEATRIHGQSLRTPTEEKIFDSLNAVGAYEFPGNPLEDIVSYLADVHQIPIVIDSVVLEDYGIDDNYDLSLVASGLTLSDALTLLLEPHGLGYVVRNGALVITSEEKALNHTETRVYNVRALNVTDPEALADVVIYTTGDNSWMQFHGAGNLSFYNGSLVIKQNQQTHREIETVLNQLLHDMSTSEESPSWPAKDRSKEPPAMPKAMPGGFGGGGGHF